MFPMYSPPSNLVNPNQSNSAGMSGIQIELENADLWREFQQQSTEMVITRIGRRIFPTLRFRVSGLDPVATYGFYMVFSPTDNYRYKFQHGKWGACLNEDSMAVLAQHQLAATYQHPDSPAPGRLWMSQSLSFHRIKLTNSTKVYGDMVLLSSMHKYQPRLVVVRLHQNFNGQPLQIVAEFAPTETQFIAVTAYQNPNITKLKVLHNPFAKGFRQSIGQQVAAEDSSSATDQSPSPVQTKRKDSSGDREIDISPSKRARSDSPIVMATSSALAFREKSPTPPYVPQSIGADAFPGWPSVPTPMQAYLFATEMAKATAAAMRTVANDAFHYGHPSSTPMHLAPIPTATAAAFPNLNRLPSQPICPPHQLPTPLRSFNGFMNPLASTPTSTASSGLLPSIGALWPNVPPPFIHGPPPTSSGFRFSMY